MRIADSQLRHKIAYMLPSVGFGGTERVCLSFLSNIDRSKFDIHPILLVRPWQRRNLLIQKLVASHYFPITIPLGTVPINNGKDYWRIIRALKQTYDILGSHSFDLLHTNGYFSDIVGMPIAKRYGIPHISTCHGFISTDINLRLYYLLDLFFIRFCTKIIAVSEEIKTKLIDSGIKRSRIVVIENAVEGIRDTCHEKQERTRIRDSLGTVENEELLGYIGRISPEKGLPYLIQAVSILDKTAYPFKLLIIGEGPQESDIKRLVLNHGLATHVIFLGFKENIDELLPAIDIFVLPSLTEGTPMALLEAMSYGVPVIASAVGGIPKIIKNNVNGLLVSPGNPSQIADAIMALMTDKAAFQRISAAARETISEKYNFVDWVRRNEKVYTDVLAFSKC